MLFVIRTFNISLASLDVVFPSNAYRIPFPYDEKNLFSKPRFSGSHAIGFSGFCLYPNPICPSVGV